MSLSLILGPDNDQHALHIKSACDARNHPVLLFDSADFPTQTAISWSPHLNEGSVHIDGDDIPFSGIRSVFWSCLHPAKLACGMTPEQQSIARNDVCSTLRTFLQEPTIRWVNPWQSYQYHKVKPRQLAHAQRLGANIPVTLISNNIEKILAFCEQVGNVIYKPVYGGALTREVQPNQLNPQRLQLVLAMSPVTLQQFIPGTNVRTYVIGQHVFSAEIAADTIDFRDDRNPVLRPISLSVRETELAIRISRGFGMCWTAIDWRRDHDGTLFFLEANPSPMFMFFEQQTGFAITEALTDMLVSKK